MQGALLKAGHLSEMIALPDGWIRSLSAFPLDEHRPDFD
jgi:hypothetical protein